MATSTSRDRLRILLVNEKPFYEVSNWLEGAVVLELYEYDRRAVRRVMLSLTGEENTSSEHKLLVTTGPSSGGLTLWGYPLWADKHVTNNDGPSAKGTEPEA